MCPLNPDNKCDSCAWFVKVGKHPSRCAIAQIAIVLEEIDTSIVGK